MQAQPVNIEKSVVIAADFFMERDIYSRCSLIDISFAGKFI